MPRSPRNESLLEIAQDCFRAEWFQEFKQVHTSGRPRPMSSEDRAWGASLYVSRRAVKALGRSLTTMERVQVLELCRYELNRDGDG
jgi:hypothetical protein